MRSAPIAKISKRNLNVVRNIRNVFAHAKTPIDFHHELICGELGKVVEISR